MWNDPIIEETRKIRDEIAARFNYDVVALGRYYQSQQAKEGRVISKTRRSVEQAQNPESVIVDQTIK